MLPRAQPESGLTCDTMAELSCQLVQPLDHSESRRQRHMSRSAICVHTMARNVAVCAVWSSTRRCSSDHAWKGEAHLADQTISH